MKQMSFSLVIGLRTGSLPDAFPKVAFQNDLSISQLSGVKISLFPLTAVCNSVITTGQSKINRYIVSAWLPIFIHIFHSSLRCLMNSSNTLFTLWRNF